MPDASLQELYASRGRDYLVVWPAPAAMHGQASCYNQCLEEFRCARGSSHRYAGCSSSVPSIRRALPALLTRGPQARCGCQSSSVQALSMYVCRNDTDWFLVAVRPLATHFSTVCYHHQHRPCVHIASAVADQASVLHKPRHAQ